MRVAYNPEREAQIEDHALPQASGFNPSGVWELHYRELAADAFPAAYEGQLVKVVWAWLHCLKKDVTSYRVICMSRHPEEVHQSFEATLSSRRVHIRHNYRQRLEYVVSELKGREDVLSCATIDYASVLGDPVRAFAGLCDAGWPIDPDAAAAVPTYDYYRFRVGETITKGA